jgi:PAS domain S-box-containing protein
MINHRNTRDYNNEGGRKMKADKNIRLLATVMKDSNDAVIIQDFKSQIIAWNHGAERMYGYSEEEALQMNLGLITPPGKVAEQKEFTRRLIASETITSLETQRVTKDGRILDVWMTVTKLVDDTNKPIGFASTERDITKRKQAEEALRASEEKFRGLFENSHDAIMTLEPPSWRFTSGNPSMVSMFRARDEADFKSYGPKDLSPEYQPDGRPSGEKANEMIKNAVRDGSNFFEWTHKRINGEEFPATVMLTRIDLAGKVVLQATVRDVTERKSAEEVLRETEERYRNIFENAHDIIQSCTCDGNIILTNPAWQKTLGYTEEELSGLNLSKVIHPDSLPHCQQMLSRVFNGEPVNNVETIFVAKDGRKIIMEGNVTGRYVNGEIVAAQGIFRDITERMRFENEKERMQHQLVQSEKMAAVGLLASSVVHELNNPLMAVTGYSSMLEEQLKLPTINKDQCLEMLETLKEGAVKCEKTVKNLLEFSRKAKHEHTLINPNEALNSILRLLEHKAGMERIKINRKLQENMQQIPADNNEIQQVFMNLIVNAFDAMKGGGTLTIESRQIDGDRVEFSIADTGAGIPKENLPKLFEPFFTTKPAGQGTGLGLPIVKKIIEEHGGEIGVESEVGKGTRMWVRFPLALAMGGQK